MADEITVSIVMSVHNGASRLVPTIESLLPQRDVGFEAIAIDDGSTDGSATVLERYAARDPRLRVARHDVLLPTKFEVQVQGLRAHPDCGVSYGKTRHSTSGDGPWKRTGEKIETMFPAFLQSRWWDTSTPLYRREVIDRAGPWTGLWQEEDWEYDCRIASHGVRLHYCDEFVSEQRGHGVPRLSRDGLDPLRKMRDRAVAHQLIFAHAQWAGIRTEAPEMRHFSRELFLLARQCGAMGLHAQAESLFKLARLASGPGRGSGWDFLCYEALARVVGWNWAGRVACFLDRFR